VLIVGDLTTATTVLRARALARGTARPVTTGALVEAENIAAEGGGKVHVRDDKANVRGTCISHWDRTGHFIEWQVDVAKTGRYELLVRYCAPHEAKRALMLDGVSVHALTFPITGGFGDTPGDWEEITFVDASGKRFQLDKGRHTIRLENTSDTGINLDYLGFVPRRR